MFIAVLFGVGVPGCAADMTPEQECQQLVGKICGRAVSCIANATDRRDQCFDMLERMAGCEQVTQHSKMYDACMDRIESQSCSMLFPDSTNSNIVAMLPLECIDVVDLMGAPRGDESASAAGRSTMLVTPRELSE